MRLKEICLDERLQLRKLPAWALHELIRHMSIHGQLTPIIVMPMRGVGRRRRRHNYLVLSGFHRYYAVQALGRTEIDVRIIKVPTRIKRAIKRQRGYR